MMNPSHLSRRGVLRLAAAAGAGAALPPHASAQTAYKTEYRISTALPAALAWGQAGELFASLVRERTAGRINLRHYPDAALVQGQPEREFAALRQGAIDVLCGAPGNWSGTVPALGVFTLPFLLPDHRAWDAVLRQPDIVGDYFELVRKAGAEPLALGETGYRQLSNSKRPILRPDDLRGLRVRVAGSPMVGEIMTGLGASPTFMSWADAQPALVSGAVEAQENSLEIFLAARIHTLGQKFVTKWNFSNDVLLFAVANPVWRSWSAVDQQIVREASLDAAGQQFKRVRALFAQDVAQVQALGVQVHLPSADELAQWRVATRPTYTRWKLQTHPTLVSKIEAAVSQMGPA